MPNADYKEVSEFLDSVPDEKLEDFVTKENTLYENKRLGMRLDHQGVNASDGMERIYIQPIKGGKSKISKRSKKSVTAQAHAWRTSKPESVKKALRDRAAMGGELTKAKKK